MPPTPTPSPRRVIFSPCPSPVFTKSNESPGPSTSKNKSTIKTLLPKLSFKFRNTNSEIEKAAFLALEGSAATVAPKKPFLSRTLSRMKSRGWKTSSLPVSPVAHSNPVSIHGGKAYPAMAIVSSLATFALCFIVIIIFCYLTTIELVKIFILKNKNCLHWNVSKCNHGMFLCKLYARVVL